MSDNIKTGADIHAGDGGYSVGTQENYNEFAKARNQSLAKLIVQDCVQVLINHGYTDAAKALSEARLGPEPEWQTYQFPDIYNEYRINNKVKGTMYCA